MHVPRTPTVRTVNTAATTTAAAPRSFKDVWLISAGHALTHWYTATFYLLLPLIAGIFWIGLYPAPILRRVEPSASALIELVRTPREVPVIPITPGAGVND